MNNEQMNSDANQILRLLPLGVGGLAGLLLLVNRLLTANLTASQARADAIGVMLSAVLILTGLLWQRVQPKSPESVKPAWQTSEGLRPGYSSESETTSAAETATDDAADNSGEDADDKKAS